MTESGGCNGHDDLPHAATDELIDDPKYIVAYDDATIECKV